MKPQRLPRPSGRGKPNLELVRPDRGIAAAPLAERQQSAPDLQFQVESFGNIARELPPLFARHWEELALNRDTISLDPDWDRYLALDAAGILKVMTARADGILAGYIFNLVTRHLHYRSTLTADIEAFWLDQPYRGGVFALRWLKANDAMLKGLGVKLVSVGVKNHYLAGRVGNVFRRMGYKPIETVWGKSWA